MYTHMHAQITACSSHSMGESPDSWNMSSYWRYFTFKSNGI